MLGNIIIWYSATFGLVIYCTLLVFYLLRRRRLCFDLNTESWEKFKFLGEVFFAGYLFHFLPYFFVERTLFLHHYLPAFCFKVLLMTGLVEHVYFILHDILKNRIGTYIFISTLFVWMAIVCNVFRMFTVLSYGTTELNTSDIIALRWKDTWDFIVHRN